MTLPAAKDKTLFTPGPLTTSLAVKQAMLHDAGSWHFEFNEIVRQVREKLLAAAGVSREQGFEAILLQGSGTFGVEAVLASVLPPQGKLLVLANGAYGERIAQMAAHLRIAATVLRSPENQLPDLETLRRTLASDAALTHVAVVHCETTTGLLNPITEIGQIVKQSGRIHIVDAMSSFGAIPIDFAAAGIDFLVSSANKCLEGVPGFSFVIGRRALLLAAEGHARSLSLDLLGQLKGFEKNGQFRYTPPTHSILAFAEALREFEMEGGVAGRAARYRANHAALVEGMKRLGFQVYLDPKVQSYIITSFYYPDDPKFTFAEFYRRLSDKGMLIYPGKISQVDCFRIGTIGRIFDSDIRQLLAAVRDTIDEMGIKL
ncbi:MAG: 2-aminoethylphosphonate--pyruvate transaminase [Verrucomicrobiota bacterium]